VIAISSRGNSPITVVVRLPFFAFTSANLFRCAAAIFFRAAGLMVCFPLTGFDGVDFSPSLLPTSSVEPPPSFSAQLGSRYAYLFGWALQLPCRFRNRAVVGCRRSSSSRVRSCCEHNSPQGLTPVSRHKRLKFSSQAGSGFRTA
jgi:hypothetical protein